ncbi:hypothetical protein DC366_17240 [Pelagivirga sediminicola]|uniref:Molybdenum ABC transporter ATP-binding protein n=1 Tax=Pelagivirga sediminicola TaxID=2170575 RepID=A0A2T7G2X2_9RHOB|nr:DUF2478 domain-containing protein [Pelagivirga sediminicola]PVA08773.1 hypothetical protein DC366_17240 [Pelagivirga sediminicola]
MTPDPLLAAIRFDAGDIDSFLARIAAALDASGLRVRGALQSRGAATGDCHCADMDLTTLGSAWTFRISQPLGAGSRGCRLHPGALADCAAFIEEELRAGADLLILNRFGRGESEGRGFRDLIASAITLGVPVLTAVRPTYAEGWRMFGGDAACDLPMETRAVIDWALQSQEARDAA